MDRLVREYAKEKSWVCACNCLGLIIQRKTRERKKEAHGWEESDETADNFNLGFYVWTHINGGISRNSSWKF